MNDTQKIDMLRQFVNDLDRRKNEQHAKGARFVLYEAASVIASIRGYIDGAENGGAQAGDTTADAVSETVRTGAGYSVGTVGYTRKP